MGEGTNEANGLSYSFKPSLIGAACAFTLEPDGLRWQIGRRSGFTAYRAIRAVRLSYRPVTMQTHRFVTEIWADGAPKMQIASVSWRSMFEQQRLDAAYAAFVRELHRRLAGAGGGPQCIAGLPFVSYWVGVAVFAAVMLATVMLLARAVRDLQWSVLGIVGAFFAVFAWQLGSYFVRNRPGRYRAGAIPPMVLPNG